RAFHHLRSRFALDGFSSVRLLGFLCPELRGSSLVAPARSHSFCCGFSDPGSALPQDLFRRACARRSAFKTHPQKPAAGTREKEPQPGIDYFQTRNLVIPTTRNVFARAHPITQRGKSSS